MEVWADFGTMIWRGRLVIRSRCFFPRFFAYLLCTDSSLRLIIFCLLRIDGIHVRVGTGMRFIAKPIWEVGVNTVACEWTAPTRRSTHLPVTEHLQPLRLDISSNKILILRQSQGRGGQNSNYSVFLPVQINQYQHNFNEACVSLVSGYKLQIITGV